jgi:hypothetical protein
LVAIDAEGKEVGRWPVPDDQAVDGFVLPEGFEDRRIGKPDGRRPFRDDHAAVDGQDPEAVLKKDRLYSCGWRVDPSDSSVFQLYSTGDDRRLTVLRKEFTHDPAREAPTRTYPKEVVLKRPLPWLASARNGWVAGVASVAAYLALLVTLAALGRKKTALGLLSLFVLLPAHGAGFGLSLVLMLLVAASPGLNTWKLAATRACLLLLLTGLLAEPLLVLRDANLPRDRPDIADRFITGKVWTYPAVLVPLIVLAAVGRKRTALGLLVPSLLLLLYVNWPTRATFSSLSLKGYLLSVRESATNDGGEFLTLRSMEAWDWSAWYWLWPDQLAALNGPLVWAVGMVGGAEFFRRQFRKIRQAARNLRAVEDSQMGLTGHPGHHGLAAQILREVEDAQKRNRLKATFARIGCTLLVVVAVVLFFPVAFGLMGWFVLAGVGVILALYSLLPLAMTRLATDAATRDKEKRNGPEQGPGARSRPD